MSLQTILRLQQLCFLSFDRLSELVDFDNVDNATFEVAFQQGQRANLQIQTVPGIAVLLKRLQQANETTDITGTTTSQTCSSSSAATASTPESSAEAKGARTNTTDTTSTRTRETCQTGTAQKTTTTSWPGRSIGANRNARKETTTVSLKSAEVVEQSTFNNRQSFQSDHPTTVSQ